MISWAIGLLIFALVLFALELLLPSGGLLGVLSFLSLIGCVYFLFQIDPTIGKIGLIASLLLVPIAVMFGLMLFPKTSFGRRFIIHSKTSAGGDQLVYDTKRDNPANPNHLDGQTGQAITSLHPIGLCLINDQRIECLAESGVIDPDTPVKVVAVNGIEIKVRPIETSS